MKHDLVIHKSFYIRYFRIHVYTLNKERNMIFNLVIQLLFSYLVVI